MPDLVISVAAINHQDGGLDPRPDGGVSRDRLDAQLDLLTALDPDVILSTEAKGWLAQDNNVLGHAAHRLGMLPFLAPAPRHDSNVVIWLREGRFRDVREHHESGHPWWHAQARVEATLAGLPEPLWIFAAHFSPFVPGIRAHEAYATGELADTRLGLGGGDFQDDALGDPVPDRRALPDNLRLRHLRASGESAAGVLAAAGFLDIAAKLDHREPTAGFTDGAPLRCDRLYTTPRLAETPISYQVLPDGHELTDHRIIHVELDLSAAR